MKIHTSLMLLFIFLVSLVPFSGAQPTRVCSLVGDLNEDRILSEADIRLLDEAILSNNAPLCGDMNADGIINVIDLQLLTLMVLPNFTFNITIPPVTLNFTNVSLLPPLIGVIKPFHLRVILLINQFHFQSILKWICLFLLNKK